MQSTFIDTSGFYALLNKNDTYHKMIVEYITDNNPLLVTIHHVFAETISLLTKRNSKKDAILFAKMVTTEKMCDIVIPDRHLLNKGLEIFNIYKDKTFDLIDSISFAYMELYRIDIALSLDKHYRQFGIKHLPLLC